MRRTLLASYRCSWLIALAMIELNLAFPIPFLRNCLGPRTASRKSSLVEIVDKLANLMVQGIAPQKAARKRNPMLFNAIPRLRSKTSLQTYSCHVPPSLNISSW
jgi:hypothetical protein